MCQADPHFGPSCECAADQQGGRCQRRLDRHSGAEGKPKRGRARRQVLVTGMDQHQCAEFSRGGKEAVQAGLAEFGIPDPRADFDAQKAPAHAPAHLVDGQVGVLQGDGAQRRKAGWMLVGDPGEEVVLSRGQFGRPCRRRPIAERHWNRRKHLHGNALPIHIHDPGRRRPGPVIDLAVMLSTEQQLRVGVAGAVDAGPQVVRIRMPQIQQMIVDGVGVDIDKAGMSG
jgi:hypothetical protein